MITLLFMLQSHSYFFSNYFCLPSEATLCLSINFTILCQADLQYSFLHSSSHYCFLNIHCFLSFNFLYPSFLCALLVIGLHLLQIYAHRKLLCKRSSSHKLHSYLLVFYYCPRYVVTRSISLCMPLYRMPPRWTSLVPCFSGSKTFSVLQLHHWHNRGLSGGRPHIVSPVDCNVIPVSPTLPSTNLASHHNGLCSPCK